MKAAAIIILGIVSLSGSALEVPSTAKQIQTAIVMPNLLKKEDMASRPSQLLKNLRYRRV
jgi:hypothetical protein